MSPAWMDQAACAQIGGDMFFAEEGQTTHIKAAREICNACPVQTQCLAYAMQREADDERTAYRYGIFGGLTANQRHDLAAKGKR